MFVATLPPHVSVPELVITGHVTAQPGAEITWNTPTSIVGTANAGFFWFRRAGDFFAALQQMILKDAQVQDRFFISPALNELILEQKKIATFALAANQYHPLKAVAQVEAYEQALEARRA